MKKRVLNALVVLFSTMILCACNNDKTEPINNTNYPSNDKTIIVAEESTDNNVEESNLNTDKINYKWYEGRFYRNIQDADYWINMSDNNNGIRVAVPGYTFNVNEPEKTDTEEYGSTLRYVYSEEYGRFDFIIDYMVEKDEILVLYTNYTYQSDNAVDFSGVYMYDKALSDSMTNANKENNTTTALNFFDGQRFECFETISGEDIVLTVHLFTKANGEIDSYKGELNNGIEFWFEPYETTSDCQTYKIDCYDGTTAYLEYYPNSSELILTAEEGTEFGNMYAYSGTYVGLPDAIEE